MTRYVNGGISKDERNHPVCKLEFLAFSWTRTEKFYDLLYGNTFTVHTNNNPLTSVLSLAKSDDACKIQKNRRCNTNNRAPRRALTDPCKTEVRPGAREEPASPLG